MRLGGSFARAAVMRSVSLGAVADSSAWGAIARVTCGRRYARSMDDLADAPRAQDGRDAPRAQDGRDAPRAQDRRDPPRSTAPRVAVFGASRTLRDSDEWRRAHRLGRGLAARGFTVVTGGYGGTMEAVSEGAAAGRAGAKVVGVTVPSVFRERTGANRWVTEEVRAPSLLARIERMIEEAHAAIALPGSLGTFTEIMVAWNIAYVARFAGVRPLPLITVGDRWRELGEVVARQVETEPDPLVCVDDVDEALAALDALDL